MNAQVPAAQTRGPATPINAFRADLETMKSQFELALPPHVSVDRFVRVLVTAVQGTPALLNCERKSLLQASMKCAQDGLLPDGREAALVIFKDKAQYMPMVAGILSKVRRSGELLSISAHVVYEKDDFRYLLGDDESIEHAPYLGADRGEAVAAYAVAKTKDGGIYREVMSVAEINQVRDVSRSKNNGPWVAWWSEMAKKTVIRRLSKRLPMSTDLQAVIESVDEDYDFKSARHQLPPPNLAARLSMSAAPKEGFSAVNGLDPDDTIPDFDAPSPGPASEQPASDGTPQPLTDAGDDFPGDLSAPGEGPAAPDEPDTSEAAVTIIQRADRVIADMAFKNLAELKTMQADRKFVAFLAALKAQDEAKAEQVQNALTDALESFG